MLRPQKYFVKGRRIKGREGQALVMFALALITICGFLALAVDIGLAYSIRKSAQSAADMAAMAGAQKAFSVIGVNYQSSCSAAPTGLGCQQYPTSCPASFPQNSIGSACLYASQNGFVDGSSNNGYPQTVSVAAYTNALNRIPLYAPGVKGTNFYVYVEITETIPFLFGGVLNLLPKLRISPFTVDVNAVAAIIPTKSTISLVE
jgi:uncharacterized membrane protein